MNVDFGKFAKIAQAYSGRGIDQTARRRDNEHAANSFRRSGEGIGVGKLAAKIESAEKGEDFTQSRTFAATQSPGQIELRSLAQNHARAFSACVGGRKQKDAVGFNLFHAGYLQKRCVRAGSQPVGWGPRLDWVSPYQGFSAKFTARATRCEAAPQSTASDRAGCDGALRILNSLYDSC
jgi:hypothetical protein